MKAELGGVEIVVARDDDPPFPVDAVVVEEDTWRALGAPADTVVSPEHPVRTIARVRKAEPEQPGTIVVQRGTPLRLLAVVHDLNVDPSWSEAWIEAALDAMFVCTEELGLSALRMPLLGCEHGRVDPLDFAHLLGEALRRRAADARTPQRIWLARGSQSGAELLGAMRDGA